MGDTPNEIYSYFHCRKCIMEKPAGVSPQAFSSLEIGITPHGLQVWCKRHDCNVGHFKIDTDNLEFIEARDPVQ